MNKEKRVKNRITRGEFLKVSGAGLAGAALLGVAGCGGGGGGGGGSQGGSSGKSIIVSSKKFTEQILLGEMYAQAFENAGYKVTRKLNLGSEQVTDKSLVDGTIDVYPEYTGTAYVAILKKPPNSAPDTPDATYQADKKYYENRKDKPMQMLTPAPFNDNYGIVVLTSLAKDMGLKTLDDLAKASPKLVFSSYSEFQNRSDGFPNMQKNYNQGFKFKDIKIVNDLGIRYKALAESKADVAIGFTTDGQLSSPKLTVLKDNKSIWPFYYPAPVITQKALDKNPDAEKILNQVSASLDAKKMRQLNGAVDLNHEDPETVAKKHLQDAGILK